MHSYFLPLAFLQYFYETFHSKFLGKIDEKYLVKVLMWKNKQTVCLLWGVKYSYKKKSSHCKTYMCNCPILFRILTFFSFGEKFHFKWLIILVSANYFNYPFLHSKITLWITGYAQLTRFYVSKYYMQHFYFGNFYLILN